MHTVCELKSWVASPFRCGQFHYLHLQTRLRGVKTPEKSLTATFCSFFSPLSSISFNVLKQSGVVEENGEKWYFQINSPVYANVWLTYLQRISSVFSVCLAYGEGMNKVYTIRSHTQKKCEHVQKNLEDEFKPSVYMSIEKSLHFGFY